MGEGELFCSGKGVPNLEQKATPHYRTPYEEPETSFSGGLTRKPRLYRSCQQNS